MKDSILVDLTVKSRQATAKEEDSCSCEEDDDIDSCSSDSCGGSSCDYECCAEQGCLKCKKRIATMNHIDLFQQKRDTHSIDIKLAPLGGKSNWTEWLTGIELILRMHKVWPLLDEAEKFWPPKVDSELGKSFQRMQTCAVAIIYTNVNQDVRANISFQGAVRLQDPNMVMEILHQDYGEGSEGHEY